MDRLVKAEGTYPQAAADVRITVLFTDMKRTRRALQSAVKLAQDLNASFEIVVMRVVPYPLPLDRPPVDPAFTERQVLELVEDLPIRAAVHIYECREPQEALLRVLPAGSIVIAGFGNRWWQRAERRLAKTLRDAGHNVVV